MKKLLLALLFAVFTCVTANAEVMTVSAYTHTGSVMANGEYPYVGAVASDDLPLGTRVLINGNEYVVADRFGGGYTNAIDIFVDSYEEAIEFGVQYLDVVVLY